jgi:SAM-dependent methyltransferase
LTLDPKTGRPAAVTHPVTADPDSYPGEELELFAQATHWKRYVSDQIRRFVRGHVLEVGAGCGGSTEVFRSLTAGPWTCVEPDPALAAQLREVAERLKCEVRVGSLASTAPGERFDTILYLDVLEHIADDRQELALAISRLAPGGSVIVLAPAHQSLYSPFDAAIGHFRRYSTRSLRTLSPRGATLRLCRYLDAAGLLASAGNRLALRQSYPTLRQVLFWDRRLVPLSRRLDPLLGWRVGKSVLGVWTA